MNAFIDYLNSTNNVGSDTTGALAEAQVKSEYYDKIKVDRKLGTFIAQNINDGNHKAYILTGHAGDGKTSILVQVLKILGYLPKGEGLQVEQEFSDFYYIKDMSEFHEENQASILKKALEAPQKGKTSLLISNTGPLLESFKKLAKAQTKSFNEDDEIVLQTQLLYQLDKNRNMFQNIIGYEVILVNIARIDNVSFAKKLFKNILRDDLWEPCEQCTKKSKCPMYFNKSIISVQFDRVSTFIENFYRYLYENDKRMTIRRMLGQLSYAMTGNLTCYDIQTRFYRNPKFDFNFANLFFGYQGLNEVAGASQIKGIEQIRNLGLDNIALNDDYKLFVTHDYSKLPPEIRELIEDIQKKYRKNYRVSECEEKTNKAQQIEIQLRKSIRRFYLVYSMYQSEKDIDDVMDQIFGNMYTCYKNVIIKKQSGYKFFSEIQKVIFQALYLKNTGFLPNKQTNDLPLTLRREDDVFQNVMLTTGTVKKSDLKITQEKEENGFEDVGEKYSLILKLDENHQFQISLPLITYFGSLIDGAIASNNNPALTHGIAKLDTMLYELFSKHKVENEISILVNTVDGQKQYTYGFDNRKIYLD